MSPVSLFFAVVGCTLFGFLAGLLSFKIKSSWCPICGTTLACVDCLVRHGVVVRRKPQPEAAPRRSRR